MLTGSSSLLSRRIDRDRARMARTTLEQLITVSDTATASGPTRIEIERPIARANPLGAPMPGNELLTWCQVFDPTFGSGRDWTTQIRHLRPRHLRRSGWEQPASPGSAQPRLERLARLPAPGGPHGQRVEDQPDGDQEPVVQPGIGRQADAIAKEEAIRCNGHLTPLSCGDVVLGARVTGHLILSSTCT
jgi:hypothetical protein